SAGSPAASAGHGTARGDANGLERLAWVAVVAAYPPRGGGQLSGRRQRSHGRLVVLALRAERTGSHAFPGADPFRREAVARAAAARRRPQGPWARLRRHLHEPAPAHR